eukprot:5928012-Prymnesium_polylepis.1
MEDVIVKYDGTVRNSQGQVLQVILRRASALRAVPLHTRARNGRGMSRHTSHSRSMDPIPIERGCRVLAASVSVRRGRHGRGRAREPEAAARRDARDEAAQDV